MAESIQKVSVCPYCEGTDISKKGKRKKKHETVQLYYCKHCERKFVPGITKNKTYPLRVVIDALTMHNRLNTLEEAAKTVQETYGVSVKGQTVANWLKTYEAYLPFLRMRAFVGKHYKRKEAIEETRFFHGQIYDFRYHRAKLDLILEEHFKHYRFKPLKDFLELVVAECPHQLFKTTKNRASEYKNVFNLDQVKIVSKDNAAVRTANFVLQAVANNKLRHEKLQEFMLANDSVTVATEVPVLLEPDDIHHFRHELNFDIPLDIEKSITGHIDFIQVRNGMIHILDYKPSARKEKPIDQLTIYALALSRLTTIRLYHIKCAWFDKENYFEFFPLHVVYKRKKGARKAPKQKRVLLNNEGDEPIIQYE